MTRLDEVQNVILMYTLLTFFCIDTIFNDMNSATLMWSPIENKY